MSMMTLGDGVEQLLKRDDKSPANVAQRVAWIWTEIPVPVIAVLHGAVLGGGLQIVLGADMRFTTADAKLSVMETKWGLCPDMSISQTLPRLTGIDVAKWLTYTGEVISGRDAKNLGLVTRVCDDPRAEALATANAIAAKSPHAIRACKRLLDEGPTMSVIDAFKLEEQLQRELIASPNQLEAVQANFAKRAPNFANPESS
jgi:enoyl-CoA hydratase/carnithine racemase